MRLKAVLDNLDELDDQYHELYTEKDGKFLINVDGIKTDADIQRMRNGLDKERNDHKATKDRLAAFHGLNPDEVRGQLDRLEELQLLSEGKVDDNKINQLVETRIKTRLAPVERERDQLKTSVADLTGQIETFKTDKRNTTIRTQLSEAARKAGVTDTAIEDVVMLGERMFEVDEDGRLTVKDNVGSTPGVEPSVWLTEMQDRRPHWWGGSGGGGATGNRGNRAAEPNPFTNEHWNMTKQGELVKTNRAKAEQMAKAAGTSIGGAKPPAKK